MKLRTITAVIIISVLIGVGVFFLTKSSSTNELFSNPIKKTPTTSEAGASGEQSSSWYPSSTPRPTLPPLDKNSDLGVEVEKLDPVDYSGDFKILREQI